MSILNNNNLTELNEIAATTLQQLKTARNDQKIALINQIGHEAFFRLALINAELASICFPLLLQYISPMHKKWLLIILNLGQEIEAIHVRDEVICAPKAEDQDKQLVVKATQLYLHWRSLQPDFIEMLEDTMGEDKTAIQAQISQLMEYDLERKVAPIPLLHFPLKPGDYLAIQEDLKSLSSDQIAWLYVSLCTFDSFKSEVIEPQEEIISGLLNKYQREHLVFVLHEKCTKFEREDAFQFVHQEFNTAIESLSLNARRWVYLTIILGFFTEDNVDNIRKPFGPELNICTFLEHVVDGSPTLSRIIQAKLVASLGEKEIYNISQYIFGYLSTSSSTLSDNHRLWLALVLSTQTTPQYFSMVESMKHGSHSTDVIYGDISIPQLPAYQNIASHSPQFLLRVINALIARPSADQHFSKKVDALDLYVKQSVKRSLHLYDNNSLCWLYFALTHNVQYSADIRVTSQRTIHPPQGDQLSLVKESLNSAYFNPDLIPLYLNVIRGKIPLDELQLLDNISLNYVRILLSRLEPTAKTWLYWLLTKSEEDITTPLSDESKDFLSKILFAIVNNKNNYNFCINHLRAIPEVVNSYPEADALCNIVLRHGEFGALAYQSLHDESAAIRISNALLNHISPRTRQWLAETLSTGIIDGGQLISTHRGYSDQQLSQELKAVPSLIILALYWPSVRSHLINAEVASQAATPAPVTFLNLNGFPIGDAGAIALSFGLEKHATSLRKLFLDGTGISDLGFESLSDKVVSKAPLEDLQLVNNRISLQNISGLVNTIKYSSNPSHKSLIVSFLLGYINENDILSYIKSRLRLSDIAVSAPVAPYVHAYQTNTSFYQIADTLYNFAMVDREYKELLEYGVAELIQDKEDDNQFVYAVVNGAQPNALLPAIRELLSQNQNETLHQWFKTAITSGVLKVPQLSSNHDQLLRKTMAQLSCLLLCSSKAQRLALLSGFGDTQTLRVPAITAVEVDNLVIPNILKASLISAIKSNPDTLKRISLQNIYLNDTEMLNLSPLLIEKSHLRELNLSCNPLSIDSAKVVADVIKQNKNIRTLNYSDCISGEQGVLEIAKAINESGCQQLILQHYNYWENSTSIRELGARGIAEMLSDPTCPLRSLNLSFNEILNNGAIRIARSLQDNTTLQSFKLNNAPITDQGLKAFIPVIKANRTLQRLECDGHNASPVTLSLLGDALESNTTLTALRATPLSISSTTTDNQTAEEASMLQSYRQQLLRFYNLTARNTQALVLDQLFERVSLNPQRHVLPLMMHRSASTPALTRSEAVVPNDRRLQSMTTRGSPLTCSLSLRRQAEGSSSPRIK